MAQGAQGILPEALPAQIFDALGNPVRRDIVSMLAAGPRAVGEIAAALPISRPAVSRHLRVLEDALLVTHTAEGNRNVFALQERGFDAARGWLDAFWDVALRRFALAAENLPPGGDAPPDEEPSE